MEPKFSVSVRFGSGSRFFRFGPRFSVFRTQAELLDASASSPGSALGLAAVHELLPPQPARHRLPLLLPVRWLDRSTTSAWLTASASPSTACLAVVSSGSRTHGTKGSRFLEVFKNQYTGI